MVMIVSSMYLLYKNQGQTCGQVIQKLKQEITNDVNGFFVQKKQDILHLIPSLIFSSATSRASLQKSMPSLLSKSRQTVLSKIQPTESNDMKVINDLITHQSTSLTYVGRLDPLAEGVLIVLEGEEINYKQVFLDLDKTYEFEVVLGIVTDSFDQLGIIYSSNKFLTWKTLNFDKKNKSHNSVQDIVNHDNDIDNKNNDEKDNNYTLENNLKLSKLILDKDISSITEYMHKYIGMITMSYPFFSSKPIDGTPLFQFTKEHGIEKTNNLLPQKIVSLIDIKCLNIDSIDYLNLKNETIKLVKAQKGDFRQSEIIESWNNFKSKFEHPDNVSKNEIFESSNNDTQLKVLKFKIRCGSGFYVRVFACWLGQVLGTGAIARNINRTEIGEYSYDSSDIIKFD